MSWTADDAMETVVDNCIKGYSCKDVAIRYLNKELFDPNLSAYSKRAEEIRNKLDALQKDGE